MYESFFNFSKKPFSLLPDAKFLYLSKNHNSALTMLRYGMESRAFITVITGDIGCGKTTLCRKLLEEVSSDVTIGLITNTHSAFGDPLKWVLLAFDLDYRDRTKVEQYQTLVDFMIDEYAQNRHTVLIVDEAQNLNDTALEELRMLSNINADEHQILQLILVGQPQLRDALRRPELTQFAQRVSADYHIQPLDQEETTNYIKHRLQVVGGDPNIFEPETYPLIQAHSKGVPRLTNILCDTALVYAYGAKQQTIDVELIREVIEDRERGVYFNSVHTETAQNTQASIEAEAKDAQAKKDSSEKPRMDSAFKRMDQTEVKPSKPVTESAQVRKPTEVETRPSLKPSPRTTQRDPISDTDIRWTTDNLKSPGNWDEPPVSDELPKARTDQEQTRQRREKPAQTGSGSSPPEDELEEAKEQFLDMTAKLDEPQSRKKLFSIIAILVLFAGLFFSQNPSMVTSLFRQDAQSEITAWLDKANEYQKVLASDSANAEAMSGILAIKDEILSSSATAQSEGDWDLARKRLESLMKIDPQNTKGLAAMNVLLEAEKVALAEEEKRAQAAAQEEIQGWLKQAEDYVKADKLVEPEGKNAYALFTKVLELDPNNETAQAGLKSLKDNLIIASNAAEAKGDWDSGRTLLQGLLALEPENSQAQYALSVLDEMERLERQEAQKKDEIQDWLDEGERLLELKHMAEPDAVVAYKSFREALARDPNNARAQAGLVAIIDKLLSVASTARADGDWRTARSQLRAVLKIEPGNERGQQALAELTAEEAATAAAAERDSTIKGWLANANNYLNKGQLVNPSGENAYELLAKILEIDPENKAALAKVEAIKGRLLSNASAAQEEGNWELARSQYQALSSIEPQSERVSEGLLAVDEAEAAAAQASAQAELDNWLSEAKGYFEEGQLLVPDGANAYASFGRVLEREAENAEALAGIKLIKDTLLGNAQAAQGEEDWDSARSHLQALLSIAPQSDQVQQGFAAIDKAEAAAIAQAKIQSWLGEANGYLEKGQLIGPQDANAYAILRKVLAQAPDNAAAQAGVAKIISSFFNTATQAQNEQNWNLARSQLEALLEIEPNNEQGQRALSELNDAQAAADSQAEIQAWLSEANDYLEKGQLIEPLKENAYAILRNVLAREPDNTAALAGIESIKESLFAMATQAQSEEKWDFARAKLQALLSIVPQSEPGQQALIALDEAQAVAAAQAEIQGWLSAANDYLDKGQFVAPADANAHVLLLKVLEREPDNSAALAGIETIIDNLFAMATQAQSEEDWNLARNQLQTLLEIEPNNQQGQQALATLNDAEAAAIAQTEIQSWLAQANDFLDKEQLLEPEQANAYDLLRKVLEREPDNKLALAGMETIKEALLLEATQAQAQQNWEHARNQLQALLRIEPQSDRGQMALSKLDAAEQAAISQVAAQAQIQQWLGQSRDYIKSGQLVVPAGENAYELLRKVLTQEPANAEALAGIVRVKDTLFTVATKAQTSGDWSLARSLLQALLKIEPQNDRSRKALVALAESEDLATAQALSREEIRVLLRQADKYMAAGQLVEPVINNAYEVLSKVLQRKSDSIPAQAKMAELKDTLFASARAAQAQGEWRQARRQLKALLLIDPQAQRGQQALAALSEAEFIAREKERQSGEIELWLAEADEYLKAPQLLEPAIANALGILRKILVRDPENIAARARIATLKDRLFLSASMAQAEGNLSLARGQLQALLKVEPKSQRALNELEALTLVEQNNTAPVAIAAPVIAPAPPVIVNTPAINDTPAEVEADSSIDQDIFDFLMRGGEESP